MKTFYGVVNSYDDKGKVNAFIITEEAERKPEDTFKETRSKDIYTNWFRTEKEAKKFRDECYKA